MGKTVRDSFFTCALAYGFAAILLVILLAIQGIRDEYITQNISTGLTLALSEFSWWGEFYYLTGFIPWLFSSLILMLLIYGFNGGIRRRQLFSGLSVLTYYLVMVLAFIIEGLVHGWGDVGYQFFPLWLIVGFGLGYLAAIITGKVFKVQVTD